MLPLKRLFTKTEFTVACRLSEHDILSDRDTPFFVLRPDKAYWYADPFVYRRNGTYYVFMEVMKNADGYAAIGVSEWKDGALTKPKIVLDTGSHLSFPFLFEWGGQLYMMPESIEEKCIQLFVCDRFPDQWRRAHVVLSDAFYDSVLFQREESLYLLTSKPTHAVFESDLFIFPVDDSTLTCMPEDGVCLSTDCRVSRMGGAILRSGDKLYRVAQDCSGRDYGKALNFMEIECPEPSCYAEKHACRIEPQDVRTIRRVRGKSGIHTYNRIDDFDVIDFKLCTFSLHSTLLKIKIVFQMLLRRY